MFCFWYLAGAFVELCRQSYAKAVEFINRVGK